MLLASISHGRRCSAAAAVSICNIYHISTFTDICCKPSPCLTQSILVLAMIGLDSGLIAWAMRGAFCSTYYGAVSQILYWSSVSAPDAKS